jgi:hypothetical protein
MVGTALELDAEVQLGSPTFVFHGADGFDHVRPEGQGSEGRSCPSVVLVMYLGHG